MSNLYLNTEDINANTNVNVNMTSQENATTKDVATLPPQAPVPSTSVDQTSDRSRSSSPKRVMKKSTKSTKSSTSTSTSTSTSQRKKKGKLHCFFEDCNNIPLKFVGDCNFCGGHFCSKHRIMENHKCEGLKTCKEQMHKRNADKLSKEQTIVPRIQI